MERVGGDDEIGRLGVSINSMLESLEQAYVEVERARDEADQASRAKTSFLSKVSHELRTPIFTMQGYLRMLGKTKLDDKAADYATKVKESAHRLLQVINDILDFAELSSDKITLLCSDVEIQAILREVIAEQAGPLREKPELEIAIYVSDDLPEWIKSDERRLAQIVHHLFSNAVKFTERGNVDIIVESAPAESSFRSRTRA